MKMTLVESKENLKTLKSLSPSNQRLIMFILKNSSKLTKEQENRIFSKPLNS